MRTLLQVALVVALLGCNAGQHGTDRAGSSAPSVETKQARLPDSLDVLFFKKPFADSIRYTRFFTHVLTADTALIIQLQGLQQTNPQRNLKPRKCLSEGKLMIHLGGDAYKVFYFSRAADSCRYIYQIKDGEFHYYELPEAIESRLDSLQALAREPGL